MSDWLALFSTLLFAFLPGVTWVRRSSFESRLAWLGIVCAVSIGVNSWAVLVLSVLAAYNPTTVRIWAALIVAATILCPLFRTRSNRMARHHSRVLDRDGTEGEGSAFSYYRWALAPIFAVVAYRSLFLPFYSYDAVASWHRWARNFALVNDYFHSETFFYPLYASWGMSFPYLFTGKVTSEYFSHGLSLVHVLILYASVAILCSTLRMPEWFVFSALFVTVPVAAFASTGYADIPATAFGTLAVALFMKALASEGSYALQLAAQAGLAAGTAVLFKMSAAVIVVILPLLAFLAGSRGVRKRRFLLGLVMAVAMLALVAPWLASSQTILGGTQLQLVTRDIHGAASQWQVLSNGLDVLRYSATTLYPAALDWIVLVVALLLALLGMWKEASTRLIGTSALVLVAVWINTANYDSRAALPAIPLLAAAATAGLMGCLQILNLRRWWRPTITLLFAVNLAIFLFSEFTGDRTFRGQRVSDWKAGINWYRIQPWLDMDRKLGLLVTGYADMMDWKRRQTKSPGRIWANPVLRSLYDRNLPDGGGIWMGGLHYAGQWRAEPGDVVLIDEQELGSPIPGLFELPSMSWQAWLDKLSEEGRIVWEEEVGGLEIYRVLS